MNNYELTAAIDIASRYDGWKSICPDLENVIRNTATAALVDGIAAIGFTSAAHIELGIMLTDDAHQRQLNRRYRGHDASTNVLAFPTWEPCAPAVAGEPVLLGDVVLAFETVAREVEERVMLFCDHLRHLIVHGVLHLLGYDHEGEADAATMERLEASILAKLGIPDPYRELD